MTATTPDYDALEGLATIATEISEAIAEIESIETEWRPNGWWLQTTAEGMLELITVIAGTEVSEAFVDEVHEELRALPGVDYFVSDGILKIELPELSMLNLAVWIRRNPEK